MKGTYLGEFEEVVLLTIGILDQDAYGVNILTELTKQTGRPISVGALHTALMRLEEKGFVQSWTGGATPERGGRRKRYFNLTLAGLRSLKEAKMLRDQLWNQLPPLTWEGSLL